MNSSPPESLCLFNAMCFWVDPLSGAELLQLKNENYNSELTRYLASHGPDRVKAARFEELFDQLGRKLVTMLLDGILIAIGYDPRLPLDAPPVTFPHDRWRIFVPDFLKSTARWGDVTITGILVFRKDEVPSPPTGTPPASVTENVRSGPRLIITEATVSVTFDSVTITLSRRAFDMLLVLAKAAKAGAGLVTNAALQNLLWSSNTSDRAVSDSVRDLRQQLRRGLGDAVDIPRLIQNRPRLGYILDLRPDEVLIRS